MAQTFSNMIPLGSLAPAFNLLDTLSGKILGLEDFKGAKGTVIMFICNHCPFVVHINKELVSIADYYLKKGIGFVAISSNDIVKYPQDAPEKMTIHAKENQYPFPYLYDASQEVAKSYDAACTPDFYVFDDSLKLTYRGQLDDSRPGNNKLVTGKDLRHAISCLLDNITNLERQKPSLGCNIKWKSTP